MVAVNVPTTVPEVEFDNRVFGSSARLRKSGICVSGTDVVIDNVSVLSLGDVAITASVIGSLGNGELVVVTSPESESMLNTEAVLESSVQMGESITVAHVAINVPAGTLDFKSSVSVMVIGRTEGSGMNVYLLKLHDVSESVVRRHRGQRQ